MVFGVLTLLVLHMLLMIPLDRLFFKIVSVKQKPSDFYMELTGLMVSMLLFLSFRNVNSGYGGFEGLRILKCRRFFIKIFLLHILGFRTQSFFNGLFFH